MTNDFYKIMGTQIKLQRKRAGYKQKDFSKILGCSEGYVSKMERGMEKPSINMLSKITKACNCTILDIWGE